MIKNTIRYSSILSFFLSIIVISIYLLPMVLESNLYRKVLSNLNFFVFHPLLIISFGLSIYGISYLYRKKVFRNKYFAFNVLGILLFVGYMYKIIYVMLN